MADVPESSPDFVVRKKVDESWKDAVEKEAKVESLGPEDAPGPETNFLFFLSSIGMQALMALGEIADPATGQKSANLPQAQYLIDVIQMLADKTKGNLAPEEDKAIQGLLYELRMKFVQKSAPGPGKI